MAIKRNPTARGEFQRASPFPGSLESSCCAQLDRHVCIPESFTMRGLGPRSRMSARSSAGALPSHEPRQVHGCCQARSSGEPRQIDCGDRSCDMSEKMGWARLTGAVTTDATNSIGRLRGDGLLQPWFAPFKRRFPEPRGFPVPVDHVLLT